MAGHSRRHSRGSIFSFTIDAVRSLSRVGSRQAIRVEDEDQSPRGTPAAPDARPTSNSGGIANASTASGLAPSTSNISPTCTKTRMPRPLSWLPTPRYRKNKVGRSISAPVLTSTTNANVARAEGVRCGELTQTDLVQSTWNPEAGWIPDSSDGAEHREKAAMAAEIADDVGEGTTNETDGLRSQVKKPRSNAFSRLKGTIKGHLDSMTVVRRPLIPEKTKFSKLDEGSITSTARRRAEGISLCKQKIRSLTGHGNVKRKPIEKALQMSAKNIGERHHEEQPLLMSASMSSPGRLDDTGASPKISRDYAFGDLEKSFMNAVDKLDFRQAPQQTPNSMADRNRHSLLPGLSQHDLNVTDTRCGTNINQAGIHTSRPEPCTFSVSQSSLVPTPTNERRPKVNPLKCHPNVTGFAEQLVDTFEVATPTLSASTPRIEVTKEELEDLENAPIYSPSSGRLSQYARLTPSPARSAASSFHTAPLLIPGNNPEVPYYTPTRSSGRSADAEYVAHQRKREIAACRSSPQQFSDYEQACVKERQRSAKPVDKAMRNKTGAIVDSSGHATMAEIPKKQQKPEGGGMEGLEPVQRVEERKEPLEWSPYCVGNSKRIIGWAPLPSSPGYHCDPPSQSTNDFADASNKHPPSTE